MRLLADEGCDVAVVTTLRGLGHDVLSVRESSPGATDEEILALAVTDSRAVLTEDKDFGQLVFSALAGTAGVILLRFASGSRPAMLAALVELLARHEDRVRRSFVVVTPGRIRISPSPRPAVTSRPCRMSLTPPLIRDGKPLVARPRISERR